MDRCFGSCMRQTQVNFHKVSPQSARWKFKINRGRTFRALLASHSWACGCDLHCLAVSMVAFSFRIFKCCWARQNVCWWWSLCRASISGYFWEREGGGVREGESHKKRDSTDCQLYFPMEWLICTEVYQFVLTVLPQLTLWKTNKNKKFDFASKFTCTPYTGTELIS